MVEHAVRPGRVGAGSVSFPCRGQGRDHLERARWRRESMGGRRVAAGLRRDQDRGQTGSPCSSSADGTTRPRCGGVGLCSRPVRLRMHGGKSSPHGSRAALPCGIRAAGPAGDYARKPEVRLHSRTARRGRPRESHCRAAGRRARSQGDGVRPRRCVGCSVEEPVRGLGRAVNRGLWRRIELHNMSCANSKE